MKQILYLLMASFVWLFSSCIEEYTIPKSVLINSKQVVIQGRILAGEESVFYVSYTKDFGDRSQLQETILNATVTIIGQNGYESKKAEFDMENDRYFIDTKDLEANTLYAVKVEAEGETYQSEYLSILQTPEIEEITYTESPDGISLYVSTRGDNDASRYYMWSYEEDWEFTAPIDFMSMLELENIFFSKKHYKLIEEGKQDNPYYRCWNHKKSHNILLGSTDKLKENIIQDLKLFTIPVDDVRITWVYSLLLKQWSLSREAYEYYTNLQRLTEESSGIFQPMPYEIKGNVHCVSDSTQKVQGYVLSSNVVTKRTFVYASDFIQCQPTYTGFCSETILDPDSPDDFNALAELRAMLDNGYILYVPYGVKFIDIHNFEILGGEIIYAPHCLDCRTVEGSTNKRPDFWPVIYE